MEKFFAGDYPGPAFEFLGAAHIGALAFLFLLNLSLLRFKGADERTRSRVRWTLALILWGNEIAWHAWNYAVGKWYSADEQALRETYRQKQSAVGNPQSAILNLKFAGCRLPTDYWHVYHSFSLTYFWRPYYK